MTAVIVVGFSRRAYRSECLYCHWNLLRAFGAALFWWRLVVTGGLKLKLFGYFEGKMK